MKEYITVSTARRLLGVKKRTMWQWRRRGALKTCRNALGRRVLKYDDVRAFAQSMPILRKRLERHEHRGTYEDSFTTVQTAKILGVTPQTVRNWMEKKNGKLPGNNGAKNVELTRSEIIGLCDFRDIDPTFPPDEDIMFGHSKAAEILGLSRIALTTLGRGKRLKNGEVVVLRPSKLDGVHPLYSKHALFAFISEYPQAVPYAQYMGAQAKPKKSAKDDVSDEQTL